MIPSFFVFQQSLPLNPNAKLDRRALPEPDWSHPAVENTYHVPTSLLEQQLAEIWSDVLAVERIGIHDHFLELGGDSLKAMSIINRVRSQFHADLPPTALFDTYTIAGLAAAIGSCIDC